MKLNVGCGREVLDGWDGLDRVKLPGVDIVFDLERCAEANIPLDDDSVEEFLLSHVIEHIQNVLPMMQELHRVAKPGAKMTIRCPYGSSDDAWEDPTHVRAMFVDSFVYFSQPAYWRADYGYRGDWSNPRITLICGEQYRGMNASDVYDCVTRDRNVVSEMVSELVAVKPIRAPLQELQEARKVLIATR